MRQVQAEKKGGRFEITRTEVVAFDQAGMQERKAQLEVEVLSYESQIAFLTNKMSHAQDELSQVAALLNESGSGQVAKV